MYTFFLSFKLYDTKKRKRLQFFENFFIKKRRDIGIHSLALRFIWKTLVAIYREVNSLFALVYHIAIYSVNDFNKKHIFQVITMSFTNTF